MKYEYTCINDIYRIHDENGKEICRCDNPDNIRIILIALEVMQKATGDYPNIKDTKENREGITIKRGQWMLLQNKASRMDSITRTCKEVLQVEQSENIV